MIVMNQKNALIIIVILSSLVSNCVQTSAPRSKIWVTKEISQCAEEWQEWYGQNYRDKFQDGIDEYNNNLFKEGLTRFYAEKNIKLYGIRKEIISELIGKPVCEACPCTSGERLHLFIHVDDMDYFLDRGYE